MTREEFWEWINTCKVHKYEIVNDDYGYVTVTFKVDEEEEKEREDEHC